MSAFTPEQRARLRDELLECAATDPRISGAAITGSAAAGREDRWSDIDLAFGVSDASAMANVLADWTAQMYQRHLALHHVDVRAGAWIYRVFLLPGTLQVDLAFVQENEFRALTPAFRLIRGASAEPQHAAPPSPDVIIGLGWLYALHARVAIARGNLWQAEYMVSGVRDHALALACLRHGLPSAHGRGIDRLPADVTQQFEASLICSIDATEISRAFQAVIRGLLTGIQHVSPELAERLQPALASLAEPDQGRPGFPTQT